MLAQTCLYLYIQILNGFRWTADKLQKVFDMLCQPEFDFKQIVSDLHKRMNKAIKDGCIKFFNMLESDLDGDQGLNFWTREMEEVVLEIMEDPIFHCNQNCKIEMDLDEAGTLCLEERQMLEWCSR